MTRLKLIFPFYKPLAYCREGTTLIILTEVKMKELSVEQMQQIEGGGKVAYCAIAGLWGVGTILGGILGGPAGIAAGWASFGLGVGYLTACIG